MTELYPIDPDHIDGEVLQKAAEYLRAGKLVAFPTETVYGIGANALDRHAVNRIYAAKKRPKSDPLIVHISDIKQLADVADEIPELVWRLADSFWPGPLTLIMGKSAKIPDNVTSGQSTVAVRMPSHPIAHQLIDLAGVPVAAPSANLFSRPSSTSGRHVLEDFDDELDLVLDGGESTIGVESTVISLMEETPMVLRPGGLAFEDLQAIIPELRLKSSYAAETEVVSSPGMLLKHYSPKAGLMLFDGQDESAVLQQMISEAEKLATSGQRIGMLVNTNQRSKLPTHQWIVYELGQKDDLASIGRSLYRGLRSLDESAVDIILVSAPARQGLGLAIWDRLYRAAEGNVIQVG